MNRNELFKVVINQCEEMMANCGFVLPNIKYGFNNRASSLGICKRRYGAYTIELSTQYFDLHAEKGDIHSIQDVLLHEMCHAMPNGHNHGVGWKKYTTVINKTYGFNIKRLADKSEVCEQVVANNVKYQFVCSGCGQVINRTKMSKFVTHYERYSCGKCNGHFKRVL